MIQRKLCFETVVQITSNTRYLPFFFCFYNLSSERRFFDSV